MTVKKTREPVNPFAVNPFADLIRINRKETEVYRGNERKAMLSVGAPAYGTFNAKGTQRLDQISASRKLGTTRPNRFELHYSNAARAIVAVPLAVTEETDDEDLFEVVWNESEGRAAVNLIELLQPLNMTVLKGQIMELPVRTEEVPPLGQCLIIDMSEPAYRTVKDQGAVEK